MSVTACVRWVQRLVCEKAWKTLCVCVCVCVCERDFGGRREGGRRVWRDCREKMGVCDYTRGVLR